MLTTYPTVQDLKAGNGTWIDLLNPTNDEVARVESALHLKLPSQEELSEIESSSRLSEKAEVLFLSMPVVPMLMTSKRIHRLSDLCCLRSFSLRSDIRGCGHLRLSHLSSLVQIRTQASRHFLP
jgi:Mg2+ and Co2+ transporter CorA